jgi:hypothetical protein
MRAACIIPLLSASEVLTPGFITYQTSCLSPTWLCNAADHLLLEAQFGARALDESCGLVCPQQTVPAIKLLEKRHSLRYEVRVSPIGWFYEPCALITLLASAHLHQL